MDLEEQKRNEEKMVEQMDALKLPQTKEPTPTSGTTKKPVKRTVKKKSELSPARGGSKYKTTSRK